MLVVVEIDLARDVKLMELCKTDPKIVAMLKTYNAMDDQGANSDACESYLEYIGKHLWGESGFPQVLIDYCEDRKGLAQVQALLFSFETSEASACMFRLACHAPGAVTIRCR